MAGDVAADSNGLFALVLAVKMVVVMLRVEHVLQRSRC
jgi:hypothetical protein